MMKKYLLGMTLLAALPHSASALDLNEARPNEFNYNYTEIQYVDLDGGMDGLKFLGSFDLKPNLALIGSYTTTSGNRVDFDVLTLGVAYHAKWVDFERSDLIVHAEFVSSDVSTPGAKDEDESGIAFGAKARIRPHDKLETFGDITYTSAPDGDLKLTLGAAYTISPEAEAIANYELSDNDTLGVGIRFHFK